MKTTWPALLAAVFVLSGGSIFSRLAQEPPVWTACLRCVFAVGILALWRAIRPEAGEALSLRERRLAVLGGAFLALHLATWIASLGMTSVATSLLFVSASPIWTLLFGVVLRLERPTPTRVAACAVAFAGAGLLAWSERGQGQAAGPGMLLAAVSGAAMGAYMMCGRARGREDRVLGYALGVYAISALGLFLASLAMGQADFAPPPAALGWILLMAIGSQVVGHTTVNWAIPRLGATPVGIALLLEPVFAAVMALFAFGERPSGAVVAAGIVILAGVALVLRER